MTYTGIRASTIAALLLLSSTVPAAAQQAVSLGRDIVPVSSHGPGSVPGPMRFASDQKEAYLTDEAIAWIRPGYKVKVNSIVIGDDRKPVVDVSFTDDLGQPLDRLGGKTPGTLSASFILAWYDASTRNYTSYTTRSATSPITGVTATQASADSGGTWKDLEVGRATYTFKTVLPATYDKTKTHTLGIYGTRNMSGILDKNYFANLELDFRPDAQAVKDTWGTLTEASCLFCHDRAGGTFGFHGGSRSDVKLCILCHSPQTIDPDTGNSVDMPNLVHKIHMGNKLPGQKFVIIGNSQSVHDYSEVTFPQDQRNCTSCHTPTATQANNWNLFPSRVACGACHNDVNFATGEKHAGGAQLDDTKCSTCHVPQGDREYDASVKGAHTVPYESKALKGLKAEIVSVDQASPGKKPVVTFKVTNGDGTPLDPKTFGSNLNVILGGPTVEYALKSPFRERADGATFNGTLATYTMTNAIPADATGTWAFSLEARRTVVLAEGTPKAFNYTEGANNPIKYVALTGDTTPRRTVVQQANCLRCHERIAFHGGQRIVLEECVICHNPNSDDVVRRPATAGKPESVAFGRMIHRLHTGIDLQNDFTIYGFGNVPVNFNEITYPGDRRNCVACHTSGSFNLPPPKGTLPINTQRDFFAPQGPGTASCLGCHDSRDAAAHAFLNTAPFGEACASCHGAGSEWAVDKVHAR